MTKINEPKGVVDKLGRWSTIHTIGKEGKIISYITVYRVCDQKHGTGNDTEVEVFFPMWDLAQFAIGY